MQKLKQIFLTIDSLTTSNLFQFVAAYASTRPSSSLLSLSKHCGVLQKGDIQLQVIVNCAPTVGFSYSVQYINTAT